MKIKIIFILFLIFITTSQSKCPCNKQQVFNLTSWQCVDYPKKDIDSGYFDGCQYYQIKNDVFKCSRCQDSYKMEYKNNGQQKCVKTPLTGCTDIQGGPGWVDDYQIKQRFLSELQGSNNYTCQGCDQQKYYFLNGKCEQYPQKDQKNFVDGCTEYQLQNQNQLKCIQCGKGQYLSYNSKFCNKNPKQDKCIKFSENNSAGRVECSQCEDGYFVGQNYNCLKSDSVIKNCQVGSYGNYYTCIQCNLGYYRSEDRKNCVKNPQQGQKGYLDHCRDYTLLNDDKLSCNWCDNNYSRNITGENISCDKVNEVNLVENCSGYQTGGNYEDSCRKCDEGYESTTDGYIKGCKVCPKTELDSQSKCLGLGLLLIVLGIYLIGII